MKTWVDGYIYVGFPLNLTTGSVQFYMSLWCTFAGGHTLGVGHCQNFADRVWPQRDPSMSLSFSLLLRTTCPAPFQNFNTLTTMPIDSSNFNFDNNYFNDIKVHLQVELHYLMIF